MGSCLWLLGLVELTLPLLSHGLTAQRPQARPFLRYGCTVPPAHCVDRHLPKRM